MMINKVLKISALVLFLGLASGCATTSQLDEVRATADKAAADAASAASGAEAARASADRAAQAAAAAQLTADEALEVGAAAVICCEANRETMDRMFEKGMAK